LNFILFLPWWETPPPPLLPGPPKKKNTGWDTRYQNIHSFNDIKYWNMRYLLWSNSLQIVYMDFDFGLWTCTFAHNTVIPAIEWSPRKIE
jgi:hypothetical protein